MTSKFRQLTMEGMFKITMSSRGQLVVPKRVREQLKLSRGCEVEGTIDAQGRLVLIPALHEPEALFRDRPPVKRRVSLAELDRAIGRAVRRGRA